MARPGAKAVILVDLDGTVAEDTWPGPLESPRAGAVAFMRWLKSQGFYVVVFTAKLYSTKGRSTAQYRIETWLREHGIPYDEVSHEKSPSLVIIDDRAVNSISNTWEEIKAWIETEQEGAYGTRGGRDDGGSD